MRFLAEFEISRENLAESISTWRYRTSKGRAIKTIFPPHTFAETEDGIRGFLVIETEDEEELTRYVTEYLMAGAKLKVTPIWTSDTGVKIYEEMKR
mgnify:CR=1 FL=1